MAPRRVCFDGSTAAAASPPADVVFEILSWLSVRSLSRSRCVCSSWRAMISDPNFLAVHRSRAEQLLVSANDIIRGRMTTYVQIRDMDGDVVGRVDLGGLWKFRLTLDGLVLLTSRHNGDSPAVCVIDLATGETIASFPRLVEEPNRGTTWFGLGRAARSCAHKVIRIVFWPLWLGHDRLTCEILTLGDGGGSSEWRSTMSPPEMVFDSCSSNDGVTIDGVVHFLSISHDDILCFDLEGEEWTVIHGLPGIRDPHKIGLAELSGTLCIITHTKRGAVTLWLLTDIIKKDVWVKAYTIPVGLFMNFPMDRVVNLVPLRVMRDAGKLLFYYRYNHGPTAVLQVYDPCSGKCSKVENALSHIVGRMGLCSSHLDRRLCGQR